MNGWMDDVVTAQRVVSAEGGDVPLSRGIRQPRRVPPSQHGRLQSTHVSDAARSTTG